MHFGPTKVRNIPESSRPNRRPRLRFLLALGVLLAVGIVLFPPTFRFVLRWALIGQAARHGVDLEMDRIGGSVFEPLTFSGIRAVSTSSVSGTETKVVIARADAAFSWKNLALRRGTKWFEKLRVDGLDAEMRFYAPKPGTGPVTTEPVAAKPSASQHGWMEKFLPSQLEVLHANLAFGRNGEGLRASGLAITASRVGTGTIEVGRIEINEPWLKKTFTGVHGTTAMKESKLTVGNLALDSGFAVRTFSTDLASLASGGAKMEFDFAAFGGAIHCELQNRGRAGGHIHFEIGGTFSQISVAELGRFFNAPEKTSGTIQSGMFTFQGSPRDIAHATLAVRVDEAVDFQWGASKWTSLSGGATLVHNRVQIHELRLKQPHNELNLNGETAIPSAASPWWQQDFAVNLAAKIDSLSELSPLLDPGFALFGKNLENMSGKVAVDGSVRGHNRAFAGQIIVSGSQLSYGAAPLDELHAAIKLDGARWQFTNLEFVHGDDYFRAEGAVEPVFGDVLEVKSYTGRLRASVADLAIYWPLIEPFVSWCEGGLVLDWSGESNPKTSAGFFHAQLKNFRTLSAPHPINADLEATYAPQKIAFSNFAVSDADSAFTAKVAAGPKTVRVEAIRLLQKGHVALEGAATLPLDLWSAWTTGDWPGALDFSGACKASLNARKLQLHDALVLTGRQFPVKGLLDGSLAADGSPAALQLSGRVELERAQFPLGENLPLVEDLAANLAFGGQDITVINGSARVASGTANFDGTIGVKDARNPALKLRAKVESPHAVLPLGPRADLIPDFDLAIEGPWTDARVSGVARSLTASVSPAPGLVALLTQGAAVLPMGIKQAPFRDWLYHIEWKDIDPSDFLDTGAGKFSRDVLLTGRGWALRTAGTIALRGARLATPFAQFTVEDGTIDFPAAGDATIHLRGDGSAPGCVFHAIVTGPESRRQILLWSEPPLPPAEILERIANGAKPPPPAKSP